MKLATIDQLEPAPYNPRRIGKKELKGLQLSLKSFGDISGIVWNQRTGHLVCGHQRLAALKEQFGDDLKLDGDALTANGEAFKVRVVDWDEPTEKAANIAANNPHIAGLFIQDQLDDLIKELGNTEWASSLEALNIADLTAGILPVPVAFEAQQGRLDEKNKCTCPECGHEFTA